MQSFQYSRPLFCKLDPNPRRIDLMYWKLDRDVLIVQKIVFSYT